MARKIDTEQSKAKKRKKIIFIILGIIILVIAGILVYKFVFNKDDNKTIVPIKVLDSNDEYGYTLSDKDSKLYKDEYNKLKELLKGKEVDEKQYSELVARLYIIDLYTLSTKINKYDVGGNEYYYADKKSMFETKVMDTLYSTMLDDTYGDRKQELPEVSSVETISNELTTYTLGEDEVDAYMVKLKWTYKTDMGYDTEGTVVICKENGVRWSVVDFQPTLDPEYE